MDSKLTLGLTAAATAAAATAAAITLTSYISSGRSGRSAQLGQGSIEATLLDPTASPDAFAAALAESCGDLTALAQVSMESGEGILHARARAGDGDGLRAAHAALAGLLDVDVSVSPPLLTERSFYGVSVLHAAALANAGELIADLIADCPADDVVVHDWICARTPESKWTALHLAAAEGAAAAAFAIAHATARRFGEDALAELIHTRDGAGFTPTAIAVHNGHGAVVDVLLAAGGDPSLSCGPAHLNGLHSVAARGLSLVARPVIACLARTGALDSALTARTVTGETPLTLAAAHAHPDVVEMLLDAGADVNGLNKAGETLLAAALRGVRSDSSAEDGEGGEALFEATHAAAVRVFKTALDADGLDAEAVLGATNGFGSSLVAQLAGSYMPSLLELVLGAAGKFGLDPCAMLAQQDYDGLTALHTFVSRLSKVDDAAAARVLPTLAVILAAADAQTLVNARDYGEATPLYSLSWRMNHAVSVDVAQALLEAGADPCAESEQGWCALHVAYHKCTNPETAAPFVELLRAAMSPEQTAAFKPLKARNLDSTAYLARRGPHNSIPIDERERVLNGAHDASGIADYLTALDHTPSVVVMMGAGASVAAGIPDYRSSAGVYSTAAGRSAFQASAVVDDPEGFYAKMRELFLPVMDGQIRPTDTHYFLAELQARGWLAKVFTQNVDMLELLAGVNEARLVEAHGTMRRFVCIDPMCRAQAATPAAWDAVANARVPRCDQCGATLRPDVVFFGEGLPQAFDVARNEVLDTADLLIVIGTSLSVYPFAGMVNEVGLLTPRVLINREPVGPFVHADSSHNYRDVALLGDADDGVHLLTEALGWPSSWLDTRKAAAPTLASIIGTSSSSASASASV